MKYIKNYIVKMVILSGVKYMGINKELIKKQKQERLGEENLNNQGCLMKIIEYNSSKDIVVEFKDEYKAKVHTEYHAFTLGRVKNPYCRSIHNVGIIGNKYLISLNGKHLKEYSTWRSMLERCCSKEFKDKYLNYKDATCCEEWLNYENFYEWLHSQENFNKWVNNEWFAIDKDIIIKGNKKYSPETCCLVPAHINSLFTKSDSIRNNLPIGVYKTDGKYRARCKNKGYTVSIGTYKTPEEAFYAYKQYKENIIKQVAQEEYDKGNITKSCYDAMMKYEVEITD